jgi:hypothetical protein
MRDADRQFAASANGGVMYGVGGRRDIDHEGLYLASESTMYRLQRRHGLRTKRRTTARTQVTRATTVHHGRADLPGFFGPLMT